MKLLNVFNLGIGLFNISFALSLYLLLGHVDYMLLLSGLFCLAVSFL
jgi:hypothetical protein